MLPRATRCRWISTRLSMSSSSSSCRDRDKPTVRGVVRDSQLTPSSSSWQPSRGTQGLTSSVLRPGTDLLLSPREPPSPARSSGRRSITDLV